MLYISRFADATLQWPSEGVAVTMSHDYLSFHDKARVSLLVQTLKVQHWEGTIQVGPCSVCPYGMDNGTVKELSPVHLQYRNYMLCDNRFASQIGSKQHHSRWASTALSSWARRSCASSQGCKTMATWLYWIIAMQMVSRQLHEAALMWCVSYKT